eukprot:CAMPEP_0115872740 /NCGR_PEP_ID=MMETSP0287-20121206/23594_1 /TAXON_ID=412157 /ORGANISM="Chrysochromulina rotalis, Strain UIO044" /LENGTH=50 /DNA_ID=CAMNT_0003327695 /DNA_START=402 /DNA_END=550 /DNA_ORIENTATION=-
MALLVLAQQAEGASAHHLDGQKWVLHRWHPIAALLIIRGTLWHLPLALCR